jgi:hypothetical protein
MCCSPVSQPIPTNDRMRPSLSKILAADTDVAKVDVPAIGSVVVTAAGEDGHPGIKAQAEPVRKSSISLRRVARVHAAGPGLEPTHRRSRAWG